MGGHGRAVPPRRARRGGGGAPPGPATFADAGPWGTLTATPILISPPLELVAEDWGREPGSGKYWFFPGMSSPEAEAFLSAAGLTVAQASQLLATARAEPRINGVVMLPAPDLLASQEIGCRSRDLRVRPDGGSARAAHG
jgi:hypothetical protein